MWAVNNPQVISEAFISSFTPIQLRSISLALLHSHFINFNHGWTRNETDDGGYSKRNQRQRVASKSLGPYQTLPIVYSYQASNDIRATGLLVNTIIMLPHIVYKLCIAVLFVYTRKTKRSQHGQLKRIARISGKLPMTAGAQQPISAIAAGDSAVTPPSILDNIRRCENAAALRIY